MGYWIYYLAFIALGWLLQHPVLLLGIVLFYVLRRFIPDPWLLLRTFQHERQLLAQVRLNEANVVARRDLARIYLRRMRPRAAIRILDKALVRDPENPELLYLFGVAAHQSGDHEGALDPLVRAVSIDPRVSFGEAYGIAGDALYALERWDAALDAYEHLVETNTSSVEGWAKLGQTHRQRQDKDQAKKALREAVDTWGALPGYKKRDQFRWLMYARWLLLWG